MATISVNVSKDKLGSGEFECKKCGSTQSYEDTRKTTITRLFSIIPIKTKIKDTRKCGGCKDKTEITAATSA